MKDLYWSGGYLALSFVLALIATAFGYTFVGFWMFALSGGFAFKAYELYNDAQLKETIDKL